ncbi:hypothetical protein SCH01S_49_00140 [Sphingomonas changbaiensis NBRC 104936]|uniref:Peptidase S1 domain-containing protein n=1 Tax=Sphingomonas changbaiensis NBRC 104936 TaxID=1219043 RepID=A0A0E9MTY3_9SPHN|nr:trypsin-like serine protease [Sphingomonas changbaiensis]GAO40600.1 hypothetical protein SCH01S_49_00140 [Sphingomonas changbaiensis NBRC 104936]
MAEMLVDKVLEPCHAKDPLVGHPPADQAIFGRPERGHAVHRGAAGKSMQTYDIIIGHPLHAVPNSEAYPFSAIALLAIEFESGAKGQGTGWFFSPSRIATAAHNLYHPRAGRAKTMLIRAGWTGSGELDQLAVSSCLVAPNWVGHWNEDDDWAIIATDHPGRAGVGWFGYQAFDGGYPPGLLLNVSGYPADTYGAAAELAPAQLVGAGAQYMDSGYLASATPTAIVYTISTGEGMSGSPVFVTLGNSRYAIGIHTQGLVTTNAGRRIDNQLEATLNAYWSH